MRVTFVRHGESQANSTGRWQGHGDSPLSDRGRSQAALAAARLARHRFDRVVASDLSRARDTARATGIEPELDPGLREIHVGAWEGLRREEVLERFPDEIAALVRGDDVRIGGGESWSEATERAKRALERQLERHASGEHLAVFSHGGILTSLFLGFLGATARRPQPIGHMVNTAISDVRLDADGFEVLRYNDATHDPTAVPYRRRLFGDDATFVGYLAVAPGTVPRLDAGQRSLFDEVDVVTTSDPSLAEIGEVVSRSLGVTFSHEVGHLIEDVRNRGTFQNVLVVAHPSEIVAAIQGSMRPMLPRARFAPVALGTLSHMARTRSGSLLVDYGAHVFDV